MTKAATSSVALAFILFAITGIGVQAQSRLPSDAWLMQNYRFTGPPSPASFVPVDPVLSEMWRIQDAMQRIRWQAKADGDYETALVAASQAAANIQAIAVYSESVKAASERKAPAEQAKSAVPAPPHVPAPPYLIALRDQTVEIATVYWTDGTMLHYLTRQGAHVQVRLDLVDRPLSIRLNRERGIEFRMPD